MLPEELRRRIAEMNRATLKYAPSNSGDRMPVQGAETARRTSRFISIEEAAPGREIQWPPHRFLLIEKSLDEFCQAADDLVSRFHSCLRLQESYPSHHNPECKELTVRPLSTWLFLDIETCGLTNSPVFLVGLFFLKEGQFHLEQLLARDYSEEAAVVHYLSHRVRDFPVLLTFNGKSFDWPFLLDRSMVHGASFSDCPVHFDVLHAARKQWKGILPNCKLQTIERFICRRMRYADIPGALIPEAYHQFVKTGNALQLKDILHHNALDLFTTCEITLHLLSGGDAAAL